MGAIGEVVCSEELSFLLVLLSLEYLEGSQKGTCPRIQCKLGWAHLVWLLRNLVQICLLVFGQWQEQLGLDLSVVYLSCTVAKVPLFWSLKSKATENEF